MIEENRGNLNEIHGLQLHAARGVHPESSEKRGDPLASMEPEVREVRVRPSGWVWSQDRDVQRGELSRRRQMFLHLSIFREADGFP